MTTQILASRSRFPFEKEVASFTAERNKTGEERNETETEEQEKGGRQWQKEANDFADFFQFFVGRGQAFESASHFE